MCGSIRFAIAIVAWAWSKAAGAVACLLAVGAVVFHRAVVAEAFRRMVRDFACPILNDRVATGGTSFRGSEHVKLWIFGVRRESPLWIFFFGSRNHVVAVLSTKYQKKSQAAILTAHQIVAGSPPGNAGPKAPPPVFVLPPRAMPPCTSCTSFPGSEQS